jgi:hypothetical protein
VSAERTHKVEKSQHSWTLSCIFDEDHHNNNNTYPGAVLCDLYTDGGEETVDPKKETDKCTILLHKHVVYRIIIFFSIFFHILLFVVPLYNIPTSQYNIYTVYITTSKIQPTPDHVDTESLIQFAAGWI